jgi:glyoxylate reductase
MSKPKVYATHPMFEAARNLIESRCEVEYWRGPARPPRATLLEKVAGKDALLCLLTEKINDEILSAGPNLKIVANIAVGFDNIDVPACTRRKVFASNTPGVLDETTADFAFTLLTAVARRLLEGDRLTRSGKWTGWDLDQLCGTDIWGKTLGLVGFGRIGRAVARRAGGFNMRVIYADAIRAPLDAERELKAEYVSMDRVFAESDFLSLHVPLLPETRGLISTARLSQMKPTAFIINTSRGPVVDEAALVAALEAHKIAGAALDVYEKEPQVHPGLVGRSDVILAPHIASASVDTRTKMAVMACENVIAALDGKKPPNALNPELASS